VVIGGAHDPISKDPLIRVRARPAVQDRWWPCVVPLENQPKLSRPRGWFSLAGLSRQLSSPRQVGGGSRF